MSISRLRSLFGVVALLAAIGPVVAAIDPLNFTSPQEEKRFHALAEELRCLVCQNQSLVDSNAELAQDLRRLVLQKMREGLSDQEIIDFLVARYSDFVLYRPPLRPATALLWFMPGVLIVIGGIVAFLAIRRRSVQTEAPLSAEERERVAQLLTDQDKTHP